MIGVSASIGSKCAPEPDQAPGGLVMYDDQEPYPGVPRDQATTDLQGPSGTQRCDEGRRGLGNEPDDGPAFDDELAFDDEHTSDGGGSRGGRGGSGEWPRVMHEPS